MIFLHFIGYEDIPDPRAVYVSRWHSNPLTNGSYSYISIQQNGEEFDILSEPLPQDDSTEPKHQVLFAGEATHNHFFSTVHGAILSGYREADRIIDIYTRKDDVL